MGMEQLVETVATERELLELATGARTWLEDNGSTVLPEVAEIKGSYEGLPVTDDIIWLRYEASLAAIRAVEPAATADLELLGPLTVALSRPTYAPLEDGKLEKQPPEFMFKVTKRPVATSGNQNEVLFMRYNSDTEVFGSSRMRESSGGAMTGRECRALRRIVDKLDEIQAYDEHQAIVAG